ncbi:UPF0488 protein CG14286 [Arctopsyche grandis]|uniref:UPF0488 protein CG14286 n=1 Tax=Arctopsyche grandis TaxID=121162 RepID=UPI00406D6BBA
MPPKAKLHQRHGKLKSFQVSKGTAVAAAAAAAAAATTTSGVATTSTASAEEQLLRQQQEQQFQAELYWCVTQLEDSLSNNKHQSQKQVEDASQVLKVLKSQTQPAIRKRQLMRMHFGDYRAKMASEEKKARKVQNQISFTSNSDSNNKSTFLRKSVLLTTGDNNFRFDFKPPTENVSIDEKSAPKCEESDIEKNMENVVTIKNDFSKLNLQSNTSFKFDFPLEDTS